jgi:hypothetical protein
VYERKLDQEQPSVVMSVLTQASLLIFCITTISAVAISFVSNKGICSALGSHAAGVDTASVFRFLLQGVHKRVCNAGSSNGKQDQWNLFYHLGGNGPWIEKANPRFGSYEDEGKPPEGCVVDQVHMVRVK